MHARQRCLSAYDAYMLIFAYSAYILTEFDKFLEEHKVELAERAVDEDDPAGMQDNEYELDQADQQV